MSFKEWLDNYTEGGIHLENLSPEEYGRAVYTHMQTLLDERDMKIVDLEKTVQQHEYWIAELDMRLFERDKIIAEASDVINQVRWGNIADPVIEAAREYKKKWDK